MDDEIKNEQPQPLNLAEEEGRQNLMQKIANTTGQNEWEKAAKLREQVLAALKQGLIDIPTARDTLFPHQKPSKE